MSIRVPSSRGPKEYVDKGRSVSYNENQSKNSDYQNPMVVYNGENNYSTSNGIGRSSKQNMELAVSNLAKAQQIEIHRLVQEQEKQRLELKKLFEHQQKRLVQVNKIRKLRWCGIKGQNPNRTTHDIFIALNRSS